MKRIPIYQMGFDFENLIFDQENDYQSPITIFVVQEFYQGKLINAIDNLRFYFPFDLNNDYLELEGKLSNNLIEFQPPNFDSNVKFKIDFNKEYLNRSGYVSERLQYNGNYKITYKENSFLVLIPIDLLKMDKLYLKTKGVFVGLTPTFGRLEDVIFEF